MRIVALEEHFSLPMIHGQTDGAGPRVTVANDENMPAVYTFNEAQHFLKGPGVYEGNPRPWVRTPK